jgi:hypothetical protein
MTGSQRLVLACIVLIILCVLSYFVVKRNENAAGVPPQSAQYVNTAYGYSFKYPAQDAIDESTPQYVSILDPQAQSDNELAEADVLVSDPSNSYAGFADFAHHQAEISCDADGPNGSVRCPTVATSSRFMSSSGLSGEEFYLTEVEVTSGATTTAQAGPFFAFDISENAPAPGNGEPRPQFTALLLRPPLAATSSAAVTALIESIVDSLKIATAAAQ